MKANQKLSAAQIGVFLRMLEVGTTLIERQPGGFWTVGGIPHEEWSARTQTVRALASVRLLYATAWGHDSQGEYVTAYRSINLFIRT